MTREEAKEILQEQIDKYGQEYDAEGIEALKVAIEVLEQEPKTDGDYISRAQALRHRHLIYDYDGLVYSVVRVDEILSLPSVNTQEPKSGHWIDIDAETYTWKIRCDKCEHERSMMSTQGHYPKFCEECGVKMEREVEE